jgi:hypothetical protein
MFDTVGSQALQKRVESGNGEGDPARARPRCVWLNEERGVLVDVPEDLFAAGPSGRGTGPAALGSPYRLQGVQRRTIGWCAEHGVEPVPAAVASLPPAMWPPWEQS